MNPVVYQCCGKPNISAKFCEVSKGEKTIPGRHSCTKASGLARARLKTSEEASMISGE